MKKDIEDVLKTIKARRTAIARSLSFNLTMKFGSEDIIKQIQWLSKMESLELLDDTVAFSKKDGTRHLIRRSTFNMNFPKRSTSLANKFKIVIGDRIDKPLLQLREI